jgi:hypothetical protein
MDEFTVEGFANRDEAIPVISFDPEDDFSDELDGGTPDPVRKRDMLKKHGRSIKENFRSTGTSIQDRILEKWGMIPLYLLRAEH